MISKCCNSSSRYNVRISLIYCAHFFGGRFFWWALFLFSRGTDTLGDTTVREERTPSAVSKGLYHKQFYSISSIKEFTYLSKLNST